jgi:hypothetical protein
VALAPSWPLLLGAVLLIGVGFGALDIAINQLIVHSANPGRVALLNVLNGSYAVGAVVAPLLIAAAGERYPALYAGGAVMAAVVILGWGGVSGGLAAPVANGRAAGSDAGLIMTFVLAITLYVGVEIGVAGWMPTHLQGIGYGVIAAARLTSGFWLALHPGGPGDRPHLPHRSGLAGSAEPREPAGDGLDLPGRDAGRRAHPDRAGCRDCRPGHGLGPRRPGRGGDGMPGRLCRGWPASGHHVRPIGPRPNRRAPARALYSV